MEKVKISRERFLASYGLTDPVYRRYVSVAPCECDFDVCPGWQLVWDGKEPLFPTSKTPERPEEDDAQAKIIINSSIITPLPDRRYVYGASCTWHGPIGEIKTSRVVRSVSPDLSPGIWPDSVLPCCPHCGGMLYEVDCRETWDQMVAAYAESQKEPRYPEWIQTLHDSGTCRPLLNWIWRQDLRLWESQAAVIALRS